MEAWQAATESHPPAQTFMPFVRPPEEQALEHVAAAARAQAPSKVVELLVRPFSDERAWQAEPTDAFTKLMAHELRRQPVPWALISLVDL
jgi:hypothetical protein